MEGGEELDESAGDGAEAEEEGGVTEEEVRGGAGGGGGPGAGGELVEGGEGELASEGEHHGQEVLGAGFRVDGGAGGEDDAAVFEVGEDIGAVEAFVASGGEVKPLDAREVEDGGGVELAEGDVGGWEEGVGLADGEVGLVEGLSGEELVG